ncbi:MAG: cytidylate kinase-like family protein [Ruminococcaceae bacterium]|jgi:cytidylate kinase|nr:cytidylate kinase-like family protein [Oscillospiraceae bacterium]
MSNQFIISVSREFGSGGHDIAKAVAEHFGVSLYDKNLLDEIGKEKGMDLSGFTKSDEKIINVFTSRSVNGYNSSPEYALAEMQFDFIKEKAASGESFVICGRCADYVLKDNPSLISIFVHADDLSKTERIMKLHDCSMPQAIKMIEKNNKIRREYHNQFCKTKWGELKNYDICVNSSRLGVSGTADFLIDYINKRRA